MDIEINVTNIILRAQDYYVEGSDGKLGHDFWDMSPGYEEELLLGCIFDHLQLILGKLYQSVLPGPPFI